MKIWFSSLNARLLLIIPASCDQQPSEEDLDYSFLVFPN